MSITAPSYISIFLRACILFTCVLARYSPSSLPRTRSAQLNAELVHWRPMKSTDGIHRFDTTDYAFPVADNLILCNKNHEYIEFKEGVDDWGVIIQHAFKAIFRRGGGTVHLSAGLFWQKTQFEIPSFCCLKGAGIDKTIIKTHVDAPHFKYAGAIRTVYTTRVSLFDFTQDGNRWKMKGSPQNRFGVYTDLANYVWMKNVKVIDNMWFGFDPHGANTAWSYNLVMEDCYASGNGKDGFTIDQYYYVSMLNSVAVDNDRHGINVVSGSEFVLVKGNRVRENGYCSYIAQNNEFGTRSVLFFDNYAMDYHTAGLCLRGVTEVYAVRNKFMSTRQPHAAAFELQYAWDIKLIGTEWVQNGRKTNLRASADYIEYDTQILPRNEASLKRFAKVFKTVDDPPKLLVDLSYSSYGTAKVNNSVPRCDTSRREKSHDQFLHKKTNNPVGSDPACMKGIVRGVACCPRICKQCSNRNCNKLGAKCCPRSIQIDASSCDTFSPPCLLSRKHTSNGKLWGPPDPRCRYGKVNEKYKLCCQRSCGVCGGPGCSKAGKFSLCCRWKVRKMGRKCSRNAPPCLMV